MFYLRTVYLLAHSGALPIQCCVSCFICLPLIPNVVNVSGLSIFDSPSVFSYLCLVL